MSKMMIIFIIALCLIVGVFVFIYIVFEMPLQEEQPVINKNISIRMLDGKTQVENGFIVTLDESTVPYLEGNTTKSNYIFFTVPLNRTFSIFNYGNNIYYTLVNKWFYSDSSNLRVDFELRRIGELNVSLEGMLGVNNPFNLTLTPNGTFQFIVICVRWSENIMSVDINNTERKEPPKRLLNKVDRCFALKETITSKLSVPINYRVFGDLVDEDYLDVYIIDGDLRYNIRNIDGGYVIEGFNYEDIGAKDIYYRIRPFKN
jgi:hypothetical protein